MRSSPPCATRSLARAGRLRRAGARRAFFASTSYEKKVVSSCCVGAPPLVLACLIATSLALAACMRMCLSASFCLTRLRSISLICLQEPTPEVLVPAINIRKRAYRRVYLREHTHMRVRAYTLTTYTYTCAYTRTNTHASRRTTRTRACDLGHATVLYSVRPFVVLTCVLIMRWQYTPVQSSSARRTCSAPKASLLPRRHAPDAGKATPKQSQSPHPTMHAVLAWG